MQRRTADAYVVLFDYLKTLMRFWNPDEIMCDHELAQVQAWMRAFPNAAVTTCLFHFAVVGFLFSYIPLSLVAFGCFCFLNS